MTNPASKAEARQLLHAHVTDLYQRHHAEMVGAALEGYAERYNADKFLWWLTGYLHDLDYDEHPDTHPGPSLTWFREADFSPELIHAVEAHANGFNGFSTPPNSELARTLVACDEICGIFYAYQKLNPLPYGEMKVSSILKRLREERFAPGINREHIYAATKNCHLALEEHIGNLIEFLARLEQTT